MNRLRRSLQREEGQALVIACLMVLVLTLAVLSVVNIGHAVEERIRLQNTADAAAYSQAALEARAFNFFAFSNRTQASQYVSAMVWQSADSFIYFVDAYLTDLLGMVRTIDQCAHPSGKWDVICPIIEAVPYLGALIRIFNKIINVFAKIVQTIHKVITVGDDIIDKALAKGVYWQDKLNLAMAAIDDAVWGVTAADMLPSSTTFGGGVTAQNDPNLGKQPSQLVASALDACLFGRAQDPAANSTPLHPTSQNPFDALDVTATKGRDPVARAKRNMATVADATRYGCSPNSGSGGVGPLKTCPKEFVTSRKLSILIPNLDFMGLNVLGPLKWLMDKLPKWGQTKLLTYKHAKGIGWSDKERNQIRDWADTDDSTTGTDAQGDNLGSDDIYSLNFPSGAGNNLHCDEDSNPFQCWGDNREGRDGPHELNGKLKVSVWALNRKEAPQGGIHWRVVDEDKQANVIRGPGRGPYTFGDDPTNHLDRHKKCMVHVVVCELSVEAWYAHIRPVRESWHEWNGMAPFSNFEDGAYGSTCADPFALPSNDQGADRKTAFNQPSVWVIYNKKPADLRNPKADPTGAGHAGKKLALLDAAGSVTFQNGGSSSTLVMEDKNTTGIAPLSYKGMSVISRAQVYYHRPGDWAEMPNFFNPYWRPRLASVYQGRHDVPFLGTLLDKLNAFQFQQQILTH